MSRETEALARRSAAAQNLSIEDAIRRALEEQARAAGVAPEPSRRRDQSLDAIAERRARTDRLVSELATMPVLDNRSPHEIADDLNAL